MRSLTLTLFVTILCVGCYAQSSKPSLTPEQKVALYQSRDKVTVALDAVKATPQYAAYQKAQEEWTVAVQGALRGVDQKKWVLGNDFEFTALVEPKPATGPKK